MSSLKVKLKPPSSRNKDYKKDGKSSSKSQGSVVESNYQKEEQFILRVPIDLADKFHNWLSNETSDNITHLSAEFDSPRHGWLLVCTKENSEEVTEKFRFSLVDLPCLLESMKTIDDKVFFKSSDIGQMILVHEDESEALSLEECENYSHGITPPAHDIRNRKFRKKNRREEVLEPAERRVLEIIQEVCHGRSHVKIVEEKVLPDTPDYDVVEVPATLQDLIEFGIEDATIGSLRTTSSDKGVVKIMLGPKPRAEPKATKKAVSVSTPVSVQDEEMRDDFADDHADGMGMGMGNVGVDTDDEEDFDHDNAPASQTAKDMEESDSDDSDQDDDDMPSSQTGGPKPVQSFSAIGIPTSSTIESNPVATLKPVPLPIASTAVPAQSPLQMQMQGSRTPLTPAPTFQSSPALSPFAAPSASQFAQASSSAQSGSAELERRQILTQEIERLEQEALQWEEKIRTAPNEIMRARFGQKLSQVRSQIESTRKQLQE